MNKNNTKISTVVEKGIKDISVFSGDRYCLFVYNKTIKLSAGVYVVTNLLSDAEPLKWELRRCAQKLVSSTFNEGTSSEFSKCEMGKALSANCLIVVSILDVAFYAGLISEMNHTILKDEFTAFVLSLDERFEKGHHLPETLDRRFFELPKEQRFSGGSIRHDNGNTEARKNNNVRKGQSIGQHKITPFVDRVIPTESVSGYVEKNKGQIGSALHVGDGKSIRREAIISILKNNNDPLTIKDISVNIKDCGEKTIQRELLSMVVSGVLKKEGERKWSRYSLVVR
jgi:hypothetical protein